MEVNKENIKRAGMENNITILEGDAEEILKEVEGPFDMIFMDAAKGQYERYLDVIETRLADGAVIAADNVLFRGYVMDEQCELPRRFRTIVNRLRRFLKMLDEKPQYEVVVYPEGDGIAICKYKKI